MTADPVPNGRRPEFIAIEDFLDLLADLPLTDPERFFAELDGTIRPD